MQKLWNMVNRLHRSEEGQSLVEYGLIIALVAVAVIVILTTMGGTLSNLFQNVVNKL